MAIKRERFDIDGMTCSACVSHVEKSVNKLEGADDVQVSLLTNSMSVLIDEEKLKIEDIINAVDHAGYGARISIDASEGMKANREKRSRDDSAMRKRLWWSVGFLVLLMYVSMGHMFGAPLPGFLHNPLVFALVQLALTIPIVIFNRKYFTVGFRQLFRGAPNMDSLIAVGAGAALFYGVYVLIKIIISMNAHNTAAANALMMDLYFESAATILTLVTVGKYLETRSRGKTGEAIEKLIDLTPKTAIVIRNGEELLLPVEEVQLGDVILIKPGAGIPVDGIIVEGITTLDESALTGESMPVDKTVGDSVAAGAVNKTGAFRFRAERVGSDTTLANMIRLVEETGASKAPIAKIADRVAAVFVPVVMAIALISMIIWLATGATVEFAISIGIAVLVVSCPCALGLATPMAIMVGTGKGAQHGILIKSAEALERAHAVDVVVLDKTGTITVGKPEVTDIIPTANISQAELLALAATLERNSEHPIAEAIMRRAKEEHLPIGSVARFTALPGRGLSAMLEGHKYLAGNAALLNENNIPFGEYDADALALAQQGKTPLFFAQDKALFGIIAVADVQKPSSAAAIQEFHSMNIQTVMLTGDNAQTAAAIALAVGIDTVHSQVMPADKAEVVRNLHEERHCVAMIGDGINDAPALAGADVGIAIGAGTDIALESADIVLMRSDLMEAVDAVRLSRATMRNIKQNLFWAFFYNCIGIPLAAGVFYPLGFTLSPMFAAAAMSLSSVFVVGNALRLRAFKPISGKTLLHNSDATAIEATKEISEDKNITQNDETQTEENTMTKTIKIEGMTCAHCSARVEKALNAIANISATVDLEGKCAYVKLSAEVDGATLKAAIEDAGYEVISID